MSKIKKNVDWNEVAKLYRKTIKVKENREPEVAKRFKEKLKKLEESGKI